MSDGSALDIPQIAPLGLKGMLMRFSNHFSESTNRAALAFRAEAEALDLPGLEETACSLGAVSLRLDPARLPHAELRSTLVVCRRLCRNPTAWSGQRLFQK
ncbi:carboxyltransferase domain-containing protein [Tropicimonas sp. IMCC6043]|uniref:carboxyltransferase domain-containing protein n=1 Tax=Tropicimonas sp. IMCC6043 TaxID=2510645 RepID=UPI00101C6ED5|nr:carboxyltransferase domain-containing protein [Tropicimonas sp. IMCC6043]RYH10986.1 carboxyltransferase domain-containing protein [Tropicimonas sp. IMCC6043]